MTQTHNLLDIINKIINTMLAKISMEMHAFEDWIPVHDSPDRTVHKHHV